MKLQNILQRTVYISESKVPFKPLSDFKLKNKVASKGSSTKGKGCLYEFTILLGCLQQNTYDNKLCTKEVKHFQDCYTQYLANRDLQHEYMEKGTMNPDGKTFNAKQLNNFFKNFVQK